MSFLKNLGIFALSMACLGGGCKDGLEEPAQDVSLLARAETTRNGLVLNGLVLNGLVLNGLVLNGLVLNGLVLNGLVLNGLVLNGLVLNGLVLNGITVDGLSYQGSRLTLNGSQLSATDGRRTLTGRQLVGAQLHYDIVDKDGTRMPFSMRIDDIQLDNSVPSRDVWLYRVSYRSGGVNTQGAWTNLCTNEQGQPDSAIPVSGVWDNKTGDRSDLPNAFTLACRDFALGKCITLGYRPWAKGSICTGSGRNRDCNQISLADHHQACTRMIRADYCGNGVSYTVNGTVIDVYDYLSPPLNVPETDWDIESRWTTKGALCLNEPRHPELLPRFKAPDCDGDGRPDRFKSCKDDPTLKNQGMLVTRVSDCKPGRDR